MNIDVVNSSGVSQQPASRAAEAIDASRQKKESAGVDAQNSSSPSKVQPEELLDQIKALTQDGLYSVRFEKDEQSSEMVVKIFDNKTQKVVRQIPPEDLLKFRATFDELVGNIVNTKG